MLNHIELAKECGIAFGDGSGNVCMYGNVTELTAFANAIIEVCAKAADDADLVITADNIRALKVSGGVVYSHSEDLLLKGVREVVASYYQEPEVLSDVANCRLCNQATDTVFNINFKAVRVCESCAAAITMQNVTDLCQKARK